MAVEGGVLAVGRWWRAVGYGHRRGRGRHSHLQLQGLRLLATKGANRAAVHGVRPPLKDTIRTSEGVEEKIEKGKEEKQKKRREVEKAVNSQPKPSQE